jgi:hypothetical protein
MQFFEVLAEDLQNGDFISFAGYPLEVEMTITKDDNIEIYCIDRDNLDERIKISTKIYRKIERLNAH